MHGETEIILTNAKTGAQTGIKKHNRVTKGLENFLKGYYHQPDTIYAARSNLIGSLLGGILIFAEDVSTSEGFCAPSGVHMTANGWQGAAHESCPTMGAYNSNESGWQDEKHTVYRLVWDWTTDRGNGTIKSVALTSSAHGFIGEGYTNTEYETNNNSSTSYGRLTDFTLNTKDLSPGKTLYYDERNISREASILEMNDSSITYFSTNNTSWDSDTIPVMKIPNTWNKLDLRDSVDATFHTTELWTLDNDAEEFSGSNNANYDRSTWSSGNSVYAVYNDGSGSSRKFAVLRFDLTNKSVTTLSVFPPEPGWSVAQAQLSAFYVDGKICVFGRSSGYRCTLYGSYIDDIEYAGYITYPKRLGWRNNKILRFTNCKYDSDLNLVQEIYQKSDANSINQYVRVNPGSKHENIAVAYSGSTTVEYRKYNGYLATVNNLPDTLTKTNVQNMKIVYTLFFDEVGAE